MKVIVPINETNMNAGICVSFGRAPYFLVWDSKDRTSHFIENLGASSSGGAGIKAAQVVVDEKVETLLVPRIGKNAADVMDAADIVIYKTTTTDIMENIDKMMKNELEVLTDIHPGFHNHGEN